MNCNCPNSSYGTKHTAECYEARIRELESDAQATTSRHVDEAVKWAGELAEATVDRDLARNRVSELEAERDTIAAMCHSKLQARCAKLEAELADWQRMRNEAMAVATSNRARINELEVQFDGAHKQVVYWTDSAAQWRKKHERLEAALRKCCRVLKDGSMGDAQAVYAEASALVTALETKAE